MASNFPDTFISTGADRVITPKTEAEAERVLSAAYEEFTNDRMTSEDYTLQKDLCYRVREKR